VTNTATSAQTFSLSTEGEGGEAFQPKVQRVTDAGGTFSAKIDFGGPWTLSCSSNWVQFISATSGSGNATVAYTVAPNLGSTARTAVIVLTAGMDQWFLTIVQSPAEAEVKVATAMSAT